ncbi:Adenylate and Guanylate cyclase catalytic domain containing protein [Tritrichomonas foetus]|uniref:Adenylate and Guanylate cyclase catalytic domain containing protein n=1 Tax=Tritrichomonas foetus TaxID=1144522 RepID=A0A1J4JNB3_9EUKA|nr:Adenylate and Guanylate cyclase catalytic domain containing protein [Tritrichomonas foetus]|eukprot:OHS98748.1 Adenylate and Guanylate cyclase catalytic domain containing protein [Tritrichomonas foetus]
MAISLVFVLFIFVSSAYFWIYLKIACQTLIFRPNSIVTVSMQPQVLIFASQLLVTCILAFPESNSTSHILITSILIILAGIIYFASIGIAFIYGGIVSPIATAAFIATCFTSGLMCFANAITILIGKQSNLLYIVSFVIIYFISNITTLFLWNRKKTKNLELLDEIIDEASYFDCIRNVNQFVNIAVDGFYHAHPACINWSFLKLGLEKWPSHQMVWFIYAKFTAIYPEETQTLGWIYNTIINNKVKGSSAKTVKEQSVNIGRQRESNLSNDLKVKLNTVSKHITSAKHKLRHVWDLAIQGNISDMETATKKAIEGIEQSDAEIVHIFHQFPNNRFVTRQYARFCKELKADYATYHEMVDKTHMLQRGININKDQAHEYGLSVFTNLPDHINLRKDMTSIQSGTESISTSQMDLENDEENNQDNEDSMILIQRINSLIIPSTRYTVIIRLVLFICFFLIPVIIFIAYVNFYQISISKPISHMECLAKLRTFLFQLTAFAGQRIYEMLGFFIPAEEYNSTASLPESVGSSWKTIDQLIFVTSSLTVTMQTAESFRTYKTDNKWIKMAQNNIFRSIINFSYYEGIMPNYKNITIMTALSDFIYQQTPLMIEEGQLNSSVVNSSTILNLIMNLPQMATALDDAIQYISKFISENDDVQHSMLSLAMYCIIAFIVILFLSILIVQLLWINNNKEQVYKCLISLPKNAVSQLTENLRVLKKESDNMSSSIGNTEMNKQEDSIMKMFVIGGSSSSSKIIDALFLIVSSIIIIAMHVSCTVIALQLLINQSSYLRQNSPHINNLYGAYAMLMGTVTTVVMILVNGDPVYNVFLLDKPYLLDVYHYRIVKSREYYNAARFGGSSIKEPPFSGFQAGVKAVDEKQTCVDKYSIPANILEASKCYSVDLIFAVIEGIWNSRVVPYETRDDLGIEQNELFSIVWGLLIFPIYDAFFYPMANTLVDTLYTDMDIEKFASFPVLVLLLIVALFFETASIIQIIIIEKHMKNVLKLILHVSSKIVLQTPNIMKVLSGDFKKQRETASRNNYFFQNVVSNLPDAVIVIDQEKNVKSVNTAFSRILSIEEEEVKGKTISEIFDQKFEGNIQNLVSIISGGKPKNETLIYTKSDGNKINLEATSLMINQNTVILFRDITQTTRYNTLIQEEKSKSDVLLSSILPPSLVNRVQAGEKNISFAVQTATIVFMDIVSFTPWCGSLPADRVMMTLNALFKKFDAGVSRYSEMTKIKCIGDCYMAAGGVFAEVNQPAQHAKDVTSFGIDALNAVTELNKELNENLRIRVGINTGGPIVAGVLGIGKPTFEILGPAINMAQQMEHHGVPMQVHVSRSVYELIYGGSFVIKERGAIDVKGGTMITYLVSNGKKN